MHELSIASALMEQIISEAEKHELSHIDEVEIHAGILRQVIPEVMQEAFREVSVKTVAEGALLIIVEIEAQARCRKCQTVFEPTLDSFLCPHCQIADVDILKGDEIILAAIMSNSVNL